MITILTVVKVLTIFAVIFLIGWWIVKSDSPFDVMQNKVDELTEENKRLREIKERYMDKYYDLLAKYLRLKGWIK